MKLVLCRSRCSPFVERVQVALRVKGAKWEERYVPLIERPEWFAELAPLGRVPVLLVDGRPVPESAVILELLDGLFPEPRFYPADPFERAATRVAIHQCDQTFEALFGYLREVCEYDEGPDGRRRYRFEDGRVILRPERAIDESAALRARARFVAAMDVLDTLAGGLEPLERHLGFTIALEPMVHNPDFLFLDDPALPAWGRVDRSRWPRLARFLDEARRLPTDHIEWMYA